jgi:hypothetical protein
LCPARITAIPSITVWFPYCLKDIKAITQSPTTQIPACYLHSGRCRDTEGTTEFWISSFGKKAPSAVLQILNRIIGHIWNYQGPKSRHVKFPVLWKQGSVCHIIHLGLECTSHFLPKIWIRSVCRSGLGNTWAVRSLAITRAGQPALGNILKPLVTADRPFIIMNRQWTTPKFLCRQRDFPAPRKLNYIVCEHWYRIAYSIGGCKSVLPSPSKSPDAQKHRQPVNCRTSLARNVPLHFLRQTWAINKYCGARSMPHLR